MTYQRHLHLLLSLSLAALVSGLSLNLEGFDCTYQSQPSISPSTVFLTSCSQSNDSTLGYVLETNFQPTPTLALHCEGINPFRLSMLNREEIEQFQTFVFSTCPLPSQPFSDILKVQSVINITFSSKRETTIDPKLFENFPHLQTLNLSHNQLQELPGRYFSNLNNLTQVDLSYNNLSQLPSEILSPLLLLFLDLSFNDFEEIPDIFQDQIALESLFIARNKISKIQDGVFKNLYRLSRLDLSRNQLLEISSSTFQDLPNMNVVRLDENWIEGIDENSFQGLDKLTEIYLDDCRLKKLPNKLFITNRNLVSLSFNNNSLEELGQDLFPINKNLTFLELSHNNLTAIPEDIFKHLILLKNLMISKNSISKITSRTFSGLNRLEYLHLDYNAINSIDNHSFDYLISAKKISLKGNNLKHFPDTIFRSNLDLQYLDISSNSLTNVDSILYNENIHIFNFSSNLITRITISTNRSSAYIIDLRENRIQTIDVRRLSTQLQFPGRILLEKEELKCDCELYYFSKLYDKYKSAFKEGEKSNGKLVCSEPKGFKGKEINSIQSENFLCEIVENCPSKCTCYQREMDLSVIMTCSNQNLKELPLRVPANLTILNMNYNQIISITNLSQWTNLREIYLSNNQIISDEWDFPPNLKIIDLENNKLTWFPDSLISYSTNHTDFRIKLGGNPWKCNCRLSNMWYWLVSQKVKVLDVQNVLCDRFGEFINQRVDRMSILALCPPSTAIQIVYIIIAAVLIFLVLLALIFYYKYKQTVMAFLYIHGHCLFRCLFSEEELDEDKLFDAFICYSTEDKDVALELIKELEDQEPFFKLCIHERNWVPGKMISANVICSVQESRRTILVLTKTFLESPWFLVEFHAAYQNMLEERVDRIIIVIKGDLPEKESLDPDLQFLLSTKTYLEWGERWFWEKIRYVLPHKVRGKNNPNKNNNLKMVTVQTPGVSSSNPFAEAPSFFELSS